jgi:hypothetical protein
MRDFFLAHFVEEHGKELQELLIDLAFVQYTVAWLVIAKTRWQYLVLEDSHDILKEEEEGDIEVGCETSIEKRFLLVAFEPQQKLFVEGEEVGVDYKHVESSNDAGTKLFECLDLDKIQRVNGERQ